MMIDDWSTIRSAIIMASLRRGGTRLLAMATVLVVDDDAEVRAAVCAMLSAAGYAVETAGGGLAALEIIKGKRIDLLLTDVVMRGLNGFNLARDAVLCRPAIKVLYYSGFTDFTIGRDVGQTFGKLLHKPLRAADLQREVAQALTARGR
jgi:CheY-like chemotaxis protein